MALDALEVLTKAIKEGGIYSVFDNVTGVINRNNAKEIGLGKNYQATDAGGTYGNTFKNAFNWSVNRGGGASSFLQDMTTARKVKPGEDKDRVYAENILKNYRSQSESNPEMVAALDLLTGRLDPQEARDVATYGGLSRNIKQAESAVQQTQNQLNVYQQSALQRGETQNTRDFNIANTQNQLAKQKARLAGLVNQAGQTFNKELNISSTAELKDFSNLTDRYGLGGTTYDPMQSARSKISAGEQLSAGDLIALASENQGGQVTGKKTARQLEQELGLQEGTFRKTLVDDLGREYTSFSNFFTDDPVIQQKMAESGRIYNVAQAGAGTVNVTGADVDRAGQLIGSLTPQEITQASQIASGLTAQPTRGLTAQPMGALAQTTPQRISPIQNQRQSLIESLLNPEAPRLQNVPLDPTQQYLNMLDTGKYLDLVKRLFNV